MKTLRLWAIVIIIFSISGCDDDNNNENNSNNTNNVNNANNTNNQNVELTFSDSGCKSNGLLKAVDDFSLSGFECVYFNYDGVSNLKLVHVNAIFNCCPDETLGMTGDASLVDTTLTITGSDNGGLCNCNCPYNLTFELENILPGTYDIIAVPLNSPISLDLSAAIEGVKCEDKLSSYLHTEGEGTRGSHCTEDATCIDGSGYCFDVDTEGVCVDSCTEVSDCPVPELEECVDNGSGGKYCAPSTLTF
jgi:hypothetical protein